MLVCNIISILFSIIIGIIGIFIFFSVGNAPFLVLSIISFISSLIFLIVLSIITVFLPQDAVDVLKKYGVCTLIGIVGSIISSFLTYAFLEIVTTPFNYILVFINFSFFTLAIISIFLLLLNIIYSVISNNS